MLAERDKTVGAERPSTLRNLLSKVTAALGRNPTTPEAERQTPLSPILLIVGDMQEDARQGLRATFPSLTIRNIEHIKASDKIAAIAMMGAKRETPAQQEIAQQNIYDDIEAVRALASKTTPIVTISLSKAESVAVRRALPNARIAETPERIAETLQTLLVQRLLL